MQQHRDHTHDHDDHDHSHDHDHTHDHAEHTHGDDDHHDHEHEHGGTFGWLRELLPFGHGHSHGEARVDSALEGSERGIWALKVSLGILSATAIFQLIIVLISGSVALLADTIHNLSDALTALPLWVAFALSRRAANNRYTYGYGRAEDVAGAIILLMIAGSAVVAGYESIQRLLNPQPLSGVWWVIAAAIIGFIGNETVALFRIRVGREIGSAALIADGQHARVDGFTSLAVLFGALGSLAGFPLADPIIGLLITIAIIFIVKDVALAMWHRLMDAVEPELVEDLRKTTVAVPGVVALSDLRARWVGHALLAEANIVVDEDLPTRESHRIAEAVRHELLHLQSRLADVQVHIEPCGHSGEDPHVITAHHRPGIAAPGT